MNNDETINQIKNEGVSIDQFQSQKEILNVHEACLYLGIKKSTLYKITHEKKIPFFCPGGKLIFFLRSNLREYLLRNRQHTSEEIRNQTSNFMKLKKNRK